MTFLILLGLALGCVLIYAGSGIHHYIRAQRLHAAKCRAIEELIAREILARAHYPPPQPASTGPAMLMRWRVGRWA